MTTIKNLYFHHSSDKCVSKLLLMEWMLGRDRENIGCNYGPFHEKVYSLLTLQVKTAC